MKEDWELIEKILKEITEREPNFIFSSNHPKELVEMLKKDGFLNAALHNRYVPITFEFYYKDLIQAHFLHQNLTQTNIEWTLSDDTVNIPKLEVKQ